MGESSEKANRIMGEHATALSGRTSNREAHTDQASVQQRPAVDSLYALDNLLSTGIAVQTADRDAVRMRSRTAAAAAGSRKIDHIAASGMAGADQMLDGVARLASMQLNPLGPERDSWIATEPPDRLADVYRRYLQCLNARRRDVAIAYHIFEVWSLSARGAIAAKLAVGIRRRI